MVNLTGLHGDGRLLDVGAGTGKIALEAPRMLLRAPGPGTAKGLLTRRARGVTVTGHVPF